MARVDVVHSHPPSVGLSPAVGLPRLSFSGSFCSFGATLQPIGPRLDTTGRRPGYPSGVPTSGDGALAEDEAVAAQALLVEDLGERLAMAEVAAHSEVLPMQQASLWRQVGDLRRELREATEELDRASRPALLRDAVEVAAASAPPSPDAPPPPTRPPPLLG